MESYATHIDKTKVYDSTSSGISGIVKKSTVQQIREGVEEYGFAISLRQFQETSGVGEVLSEHFTRMTPREVSCFTYDGHGFGVSYSLARVILCFWSDTPTFATLDSHSWVWLMDRFLACSTTSTLLYTSTTGQTGAVYKSYRAA